MIKRFKVFQLLVLMLLLLTGQTAMAQMANYEKMSNRLTDLLDDYEANNAQARRAGQVTSDPIIMALVKADSEEALTSNGVMVLDHLDNIYFTAMPISHVASLSNDYRVARIEVGRDVHFHTDRTPSYVGAEAVWNGTDYINPINKTFTGKGVLVGVCDGGFDYNHPMFLKADGTSRIKWAWDCYTGRGATEGYAGIGSYYDTSEKILKAGGSIDRVMTHGTFVAAIAAGSSITSPNNANHKYSGIAPDADLCLFMQGNLLNGIDPADEDGERTFGDNVKKDIQQAYASASASIKEYFDKAKDKVTTANVLGMLGIKHFFDYATEQKKPAVLNCSWGSPMSFFDDELLDKEFFEKLVQTPGHIIVASAGNEGDEDYYRKKEANQQLSDSIISKKALHKIEFSTTSYDFTLTLRYSDAAHTEVTFKPSDLTNIQTNMKTVEVNCGGFKMPFGINKAKKKNGINGMTYWQLELRFPDKYDKEEEHGDDETEPERKAAFIVNGSAEMVFVSTYNENNFKGRDKMKNAPYTINIPSAFPGIISVGAVNHRNTYINQKGKETTSIPNQNGPDEITSWSSCGPTLDDGRMKPDVCAPGYNIISAFNSYMDPLMALSKNLDNVMVDAWRTPNNHRAMMIADSGTSFATPVVVGTIALWLEADPTLTSAKVLDIIKATATKVNPAASVQYPNNTYGYGEIAAYAGIRKVLNIDTAIPGLPREQVKVTLEGRTLHIEGYDEAQVTLYSLNGQQVFSAVMTNGSVQLPVLNTGVYAVKVGNEASTLIRL